MEKKTNGVDSHFENSITHKEENSSVSMSDFSDDESAMQEYVRDLHSECFHSLLLISLGVGHKVNEENKRNPRIKDALKLLSRQLKSKCRYYLDQDHSLCFQFKGGKEFEESNESGLVVLLGVFACLRINLTYLEKQNAELEGLNILFTTFYPDIMSAYNKISNEFAFDGTVQLGFNTSDPDELLVHLKNMKIERWSEKVNSALEISKESNVNDMTFRNDEKNSSGSDDKKKIGLSNVSVVKNSKAL